MSALISPLKGIINAFFNGQLALATPCLARIYAFLGVWIEQ